VDFIDKKTIYAQERLSFNYIPAWPSYYSINPAPPFVLDKHGHCSSPISYLHIYLPKFGE
jgi:hypothetical protein